MPTLPCFNLILNNHIVNFNDIAWLEDAHVAVQDVYNDLLGYLGTPNSQKYKDFLASFPKNQYNNSGQLVNDGGELHEGVITVENDENSGIWKIQSIEGKDLTYFFETWDSGTLETTTIGFNSFLQIAGNSQLYLQTSLANGGTIVHNNPNYLYFTNGIINNVSIGTYQLKNGKLSNYSGTNTFNNSGKFEKIGPENAYIYIPFNNTNGTVEIENGILNINSTYTANNNSTIEININGLNEFGKLDFNTSVNLTGNLDINLAPNYTPKAGDRFQIIDYNSAQGKFN